MIGGVSRGLGQYLRVDPVLLRVAAVALTLCGGAGVLLYLLGWIALPPEPVEAPSTPGGRRPIAASIVVGSMIAAMGTVLLVMVLVPWWTWVWPCLLLAIGLMLIASAWQR